MLMVTNVKEKEREDRTVEILGNVGHGSSHGGDLSKGLKLRDEPFNSLEEKHSGQREQQVQRLCSKVFLVQDIEEADL